MATDTATHLHVPTRDMEYGIGYCRWCHERIVPNESNSGWTTVLEGQTIPELLKFYMGLSIPELRKRQGLCGMQKTALYDEAEKDNFRFNIRRHRAQVRLDTTEELLREAVEELAFG